MRKTVISPNTVKDPGYECTAIVVRELIRLGAEIYMSDEHKDCPIKDGVTFLSEGLYDSADVVIVLGGDGSILDAARTVYREKLPILGINLGRVGYMASLEPEELELLSLLFSEEYTIDERMMLEARIIRNGETVTVTTPALNDIAFTRGTFSRMLDIELECNSEFAGNYRADGLIFATPTGSTAYSMSAGGPVLDPGLDALAVTPICPNYLSSCPMVFSGEAKFAVSAKDAAEWYMTVDGKEYFTLMPGDRVVIARSGYTTLLVNIKKNAFYHVLRKKTSEKQ